MGRIECGRATCDERGLLEKDGTLSCFFHQIPLVPRPLFRSPPLTESLEQATLENTKTISTLKSGPCFESDVTSKTWKRSLLWNVLGHQSARKYDWDMQVQARFICRNNAASNLFTSIGFHYRETEGGSKADRNYFIFFKKALLADHIVWVLNLLK